MRKANEVEDGIPWHEKESHSECLRHELATQLCYRAALEDEITFAVSADSLLTIILCLYLNLKCTTLLVGLVMETDIVSQNYCHIQYSQCFETILYQCAFQLDYLLPSDTFWLHVIKKGSDVEGGTEIISCSL